MWCSWWHIATVSWNRGRRKNQRSSKNNTMCPFRVSCSSDHLAEVKQQILTEDDCRSFRAQIYSELREGADRKERMKRLGICLRKWERERKSGVIFYTSKLTFFFTYPWSTLSDCEVPGQLLRLTRVCVCVCVHSPPCCCSASPAGPIY